MSYVIQRLGKDAKGKYRKLEDSTSTLFPPARPAPVDVTDEAAIPLDYKNATVKMSAAYGTTSSTLSARATAKWRSLPLLADLSVTVDKTAIKGIDPGGFPVPDAKLIED